MEWEKAFIEYSFDAAVGRLFRGLIHNLNGVGQAFSMQAELLVMMFDQADKTLDIIEKSDSIEEARSHAGILREMIARRSGLTEHLVKEVNVLHDIMRRCSNLMAECRDPGTVQAYKLRDVIRTELEFLSADSFFKHKVRKEVISADNIPALVCHQVALHKILAVLLENASLSMEKGVRPEGEPAKLQIRTSREDDQIRIDIADNGPGVDDALREKIFEPFVSGFSRTGLGLFLGRAIAASLHGEIVFTSQPGSTCFTLKLPLSEVTFD